MNIKNKNINEKKNVCFYYSKKIKKDSIIGIGTGSTIKYFIEYLGAISEEMKCPINVIPTSYQSKYECFKNGVICISEFNINHIDVYVDGADQVCQNFFAIKGYGCALLKEKILGYASKKIVILVDETKLSSELNIPVPIEIYPFAISFVMSKLEEINGVPKLRKDSLRNKPTITENGNFIVDCDFGAIKNPKKLEQ